MLDAFRVGLGRFGTGGLRIRSWADYPDYYIGLASARKSSWSRASSAPSLSPSTGELLIPAAQQRAGIEPGPIGELFNRLEREVAFPSLDRAGERTMDLQHLGGERLLAEAQHFAVAAQVAPDGPL